MKLKSFRVQNFRSIIDSTLIRLSDVTVLIGPNQAGKSSILQGLNKLSFDETFDPFDLTQLKETYKQYIDGELKAHEIPIATGTFEIDPAEQSELKATLPDGVDVPQTLTITKTYDNWYRFTIGGVPIAFPSRSVINDGIESLTGKLQDLETWSRQHHLQRGPNNQFQAPFLATLEELRKLIAGDVPLSKSFEQKSAALLNQDWDSQFKNELSQRVKDLCETARLHFADAKPARESYAYFAGRIPRTAYFKTYDRLEDEAPLKDLVKPSEQHRTFMNLLKLADLRVETLHRIDNEKQRQAYIENASGRVTRLLQRAWKQEQLQVQFRLSEGKLMVFTKDSAAVETLLPPSSGSEGFQWWLGFYISFGASTNSEYKNAILLLDDPGVFLHPTGHKDLLKLFDDYLSNNVTTIYTTQVPFLIPRDKLERLRLVTKDEAGRSFVDEKFYTGHDTDVLAPVRAALGVSLGDSLFAGELTIVTEGLSDMILLYAILKELKKRGIRQVVDTDKVHILGGSGAPSIRNLALLLQIQNLPFAILLDNDEEGRRAKADFPEKGIPAERIVMIALPETKAQTDADIEDLFPLEMFAEAFYQVHGKRIAMSKDQIARDLAKGNAKVCNRAKAVLLKAGGKYELDKTSIAYELASIMERAESLPPRLVDTISALVDDLSGQLKIYEGRSSTTPA